MENQTVKTFVMIGGFMMALSVALGAFGAHALKASLEPRMFEIYNTAVQYQVYHALGMFAVAFLAYLNPSNSQVKLSGYIMLGSTVIFSGSLYMLSVLGIKWMGAVTPIGGTGFIISWVFLALSINNKEA
jgi:uncharacterized membrane protein YgdD (TMEM256/DUF423 family)